jgi:gamma-glutamyltranspeptidase/glutathione hydrolase
MPPFPRALVIAGALLAMNGITSQDTSAARGQATRSVVYGTRGMVCAAQPLAVQAGIDMLKQGGSAVDAAIATNACLGLMEPTANGLGGDLFAIVWDPKTKQLAGLNACGRSPLGLRAEQIPPEKDGTIPLYSPYSWSVPGCADGWFELHAKYGKLPLATVLAPAIHYAEHGFPLSPVIANDWGRSVPRFKDKPGFAAVFMPGGRAPAEGEIFRNPALAKTLRLIAEGGRKAYYEGPIAEAIVAYSQQNGGFFAKADFAKHKSEWVAPVSTNYRGWDVWELPPPGQGIAALQILNLLEGYDLKAMGRESADFWHVMVEAKKVAYADRARYYADPDFAQIPVAELIAKPYAAERAKAIDLAHAATADAPGDPRLSRRETTYLCTADGDGMMVSLIQSNYTGFGSGYVVPALGFGLQDRGNLFDLAPGKPNSYAPGKRPFHTIIPAFVTKDGAPLMAFGLMGGDMQPQGHAQVIVNLVDFGMNLQEAGDAIRYHHSGSAEPTGTPMEAGGGVLHIEDGLPDAVLAELARRGHVIKPEAVGAYGGYQAIRRDPVTGVYSGATEKRKDGCAIGW